MSEFNSLLGGPEGRGIRFTESIGPKGRRLMSFEYLDFNGYHLIQIPENKLLILLFTACMIAGQYRCYWTTRPPSSDGLLFTVVSDNLSGDGDTQAVSAKLLNWLLGIEDGTSPIRLTKSTDDHFPCDCIADNLAGWLTSALNEPGGELAAIIRDEIDPQIWGVGSGWYELVPSADRIESRPAIDRLKPQAAAAP